MAEDAWERYFGDVIGSQLEKERRATRDGEQEANTLKTRKGLITIGTKTVDRNKAIPITRLLIALLIGGSFPFAQARQTGGRLFVRGNLQASYYAEARSQQFMSIGQGVAEGESLRLAAQSGPMAMRVMKANSGSARYSVVIAGGKEDVRVRDLPYDITVTVHVPESNSNLPLVLYVIPD